MKPIRVLAFLEATSLTGPAKNLLQFGTLALRHDPPVELTLVTFRRPEQPPADDFLRAVAEASLPCEILREVNAIDFRTIGQIRQLVRRLRPDIVQTHNVKSGFLVWLSWVWRRYCWIHWHHGYTTPTFKQVVYNYFNHVTIRYARLVISVTRAFVPELEKAGVPRERIAFVPNAIRPDWDIGPADPAAAGPAKVIVSIGRLSSEKAHADLVEALALLQQQPAIPPLRLLLVGDGPERQNLQTLAAARNVEVSFAGHVADVRPFYRQADVFVLPSLSEGSPNVLIEAMAAGNAIIATNVGGIPETVDHEKEALLTPPGKPAELSAAIAKVLLDPALAQRLAQAARERVRREFLPEVRVRRIAGLYTSTLNG